MNRTILVISVVGVLLTPSLGYAASQRAIRISVYHNPSRPLPTVRETPLPIAFKNIGHQPIGLPKDPLVQDGCMISWNTWWSRYSNEKLVNVSTTADKLRGIARFVTVHEGRFGLTVMTKLPIMVPSNTTTVLINGESIPRDSESEQSCISKLLPLMEQN